MYFPPFQHLIFLASFIESIGFLLLYAKNWTLHGVNRKAGIHLNRFLVFSQYVFYHKFRIVNTLTLDSLYTIYSLLSPAQLGILDPKPIERRYLLEHIQNLLQWCGIHFRAQGSQQATLFNLIYCRCCNVLKHLLPHPGQE